MAIEHVAQRLDEADNTHKAVQAAARSDMQYANELAAVQDPNSQYISAARKAITQLFEHLSIEAERIQEGHASRFSSQATTGYRDALEGSQHYNNPEGPFRQSTATTLAAVEVEDGARAAVNTIDDAERQVLGVLDLAMGVIAMYGRGLHHTAQEVETKSLSTVAASRRLAEQITGKPAVD
jgi:flagellar biosynthesis/type III secretory pathway protein FliH